MLKRELYLSKIRHVYHNELVKVLTGLRRSGKSVILNQIIDELKNENVKDSNILYMNMESFKNDKYKNKNLFYDYVTNYFKDVSGKVYMFIDEVQLINEFEIIINSFRVDFDSSIFITGSNSELMSKELATFLTGRYITYNIQPFTYNEYCIFLDVNYKENQNFIDYYMFGGYPQVITLKDTNTKQSLLNDIKNSILFHDIAKRHNLKDIDLLSKVTDYLIEHTSNVISVEKLKNYLSSNQKSVSLNTLYSYINAIEDGLIVSRCKRFDEKGKSILKKESKMYISDIGIRNNIKKFERIDFGKTYETLVYTHLIALGYNVNVVKIKDYEVDFIARLNGNIKYIQVCKTLVNAKTEEREFRSLYAIQNNYPKYIITDDENGYSKDGIIHINIKEFLNNINF